MMQTYTRLVATIAMGAMLIGCTTTDTTEGTTDPEVIEIDTSTDTTTDESDGGTGVSDGSDFQVDELDDPSPSNLLRQRIVYFEFNKSDVRAEDRAVIEAHADYLQRNPGATMSLEGHADERGTREYNNALGERRAKAVRNLITLQGGSGQQIRTVSWGEERPIDRAHDEGAWAQNRRVEIVYLTRQ